MEALGAIGILLASVLVIVLAILAVLMPYFIYKIAYYSRLTYELLARRDGL